VWVWGVGVGVTLEQTRGWAQKHVGTKTHPRAGACGFCGI
jgi:hypothetical protein